MDNDRAFNANPLESYNIPTLGQNITEVSNFEQRINDQHMTGYIKTQAKVQNTVQYTESGAGGSGHTNFNPDYYNLAGQSHSGATGALMNQVGGDSVYAANNVIHSTGYSDQNVLSNANILQNTTSMGNSSMPMGNSQNLMTGGSGMYTSGNQYMNRGMNNQSNINYLSAKDEGGMLANLDYANAPRKVVDVVWMLVAAGILMFVFISYIFMLPYSMQPRLYKGINYQGLTCGIDHLVGELPYLYYPLDPRSSYAVAMINDPMCVDKCPNEDDVKARKTVPVSIADTSIDRDASSAVASEVKLQSPVYATKLVANAYCVPLDDNIAEQTLVPFSDNIHRLHFAIGSYHVSLYAILLNLIFCSLICAGFYYLVFSTSALIVSSACAMCSIVCILSGVNHLAGGSLAAFNTIKGTLYSSDYALATLLGFTFLAIGSIIGFIGYLTKYNSLLTTRLLRCALVAIDDLKIFYRLALINAGAIIGLVIVFSSVAMSVVSAGSIDNSEENLAISENGNTGLVPLHRQIIWDSRSVPILLLVTIAFFIMLEFILATMQFVVSYAVTVWFFSPCDNATGKRKFRELNAHPELVGLGLAFTYHLGSLFLSSILMPLTRPFSLFMSFSSRRSYAIDDTNNSISSMNNSLRQYNDGTVDTNNNISAEGVQYYAPVPGSFFYNGLLYRYNYHLKKILGKNYTTIANLVDKFSTSGYVEMSVSATGFGESMEAAHFRINETNSVVGFLHGSTKNVFLMINLLIATLTSGILYYNLTSYSRYANPESTSFCQAPAFISLFVFAVSCYISAIFTTIFDTASDVLLFCYMVESVCSASFDDSPSTKIHAPQELKELICELQSY